MAISEALLGSLISAGAAVAGAGTSAGVASTANRRAYKWTKKMYDVQRADYLSDRDYNLPANQMQRYIDAGLNPNLIYGQLDNQAFGPSMQHAQTDSSAAYLNDGFSRLQRSIDLFEKIRQDEKARQVMDAQIAESNARKDYYDALGKRTNTLEGIDALKLGAFTRGSYFDEYVRQQVFKNVGLDLSNRFAQATYENRVESVFQNLNWLKLRNEGLRYDNRFKSGIMKVDDYWLKDYWEKRMMMPALKYHEQGIKNQLWDMKVDLAKSQKDLFESRSKYTDIKKMIAPLQLLIDLLNVK